MKKIGIIGAMPEEVNILKEKLEGLGAHHQGGIDIYTGSLHGSQVALCCSGMGKASAAAATQLLITGFDVQMVINSGIAGNMTPELGVGDVAISEEVTYHDATLSMLSQSYPFKERFTADPALVAAAQKACEELSIHSAVGTIATGDQFICEAAVKERIAREYAPLCVEMEGAAIAHIAMKNDVPFVIIRSMSDDADESAKEKLVIKKFDITEYCQTASAISEHTIRHLGR
ncbi:5'-methylthioadenosine/adenosylhomocysteine nucleosidase [Zongyangia hominis]|uniref:adenosylhomocysteine nucleosidase n=1 Tax=Zongyangia hominis TaxID=2763677 RepID=A0A926EBL9_9FIRM|nr:5'-methylthioadenosine/adenosylhomocysteine nucleosidase [Zongyangia hominis]MBC8569374.1 5'-methylthioadenosine/adenosylhomocysteine nucleosidase [Zongyangia hominis]